MNSEFEKKFIESEKLNNIKKYMENRGKIWEKEVPSFEEFEEELHRRMADFEKELIKEELERYDVKKKR